MQKKDKKCFYINSHGPDKDSLVKGFKWLVGLCSSGPLLCKALIAIPVKKSILSGVISQVIGKQGVKSLAMGNKVKFCVNNKTLEISLLIEKQNIYEWKGPILAVYPNKKLLDKIDGLYGVTHVLIVPWSREEVEFWINRWSACDLDNPSSPRRREILSNKVVEEALKSLTNTVNLSTGISHPNDREKAINLFMRLKQAGEIFNPEEIRDWLIAESGWNPQYADGVKDVAEKVLEGHRFRKIGKWWKDDIVEYWRKSEHNSG